MRALQVTMSSTDMAASGSPATSHTAVTLTLGMDDNAVSTSSTCSLGRAHLAEPSSCKSVCVKAFVTGVIGMFNPNMLTLG